MKQIKANVTRPFYKEIFIDQKKSIVETAEEKAIDILGQADFNSILLDLCLVGMKNLVNVNHESCFSYSTANVKLLFNLIKIGSVGWQKN